MCCLLQDRADAKAKFIAAKAAGGGGSGSAAKRGGRGGAKRSRFKPQFGAAQVGGAARGKAPPERGLQIHTQFDEAAAVEPEPEPEPELSN